MSDQAAPTPHPDETRGQFMTKPTGETLLNLEGARLDLGFLSANALGVVILNEFSKVPPGKFWECLAKVRSYHRSQKPDTPRKGRRA